MRGGICSIQLQALTPEAAIVVKQAVNLATRRGHSQVTPLHVASAMLATSTGLLKKACLQCHSHPLQCKALELCFNVALNRLPASTPNPLLGHHHHHYSSSTPSSLSNALVAAFKRAQAHQRRGSVDNQQNQQHILALKIEVEQLIISILDDPSVSRVMREAGFSSTLVKCKVEQSVSTEASTQLQKASPKDHSIIIRPQILGGGNNSSFITNHNEDVTILLNELVKRRKNTVIVGESLSNAEGIAKGVMEKFEVGNVPEELRYVQFVSLPLMYFKNIGKEEVELKFMEIRSLVKSYVGGRGGVVLYLGDLKWLFEFWSSYCEEIRTRKYYCSVEHMVMELKKLVEDSSRVWLMGISSFKGYMKCKMCHPSLETIWELNPFTIPVGSLSLSLNFDREFQGEERSNKVVLKEVCFEENRVGGVRKHLNCCRDCSVNFEKEAQSITKKVMSNASLPPWLQTCKQEKTHIMEDEEENATRLKDLCKKWNSFCNSVHKRHILSINLDHKPILFGNSSSTPSSPNSISSHHGLINWPIIISEPEKAPKECADDDDEDCYDGNLIMFMPKPDLLSNPNSSPNSASSSEAVEGLDSTEMFKEDNAENLRILCDALESKAPQCRAIVPEIATTILHCRSKEGRQETWMAFVGDSDSSREAKERVSREIAKVVFGSYSNLAKIGVNSFSCSKSNGSKRKRDEFGSSYVERFGEMVNENPHRVFLMEDLDELDYFERKGLKEAIESGSVRIPCGENVPLKDAIVIFMSSSSNSLKEKNNNNVVDDDDDNNNNLEKKKCSTSLSLDLNIQIEDDDVGFLELVDKKFDFNLQDL